jgi:hypothetical protein
MTESRGAAPADIRDVKCFCHTVCEWNVELAFTDSSSSYVDSAHRLIDITDGRKYRLTIYGRQASGGNVRSSTGQRPEQ